MADTNRGIHLRRENERVPSDRREGAQRGGKTDVRVWKERGKKFMLCSFSP